MEAELERLLGRLVNAFEQIAHRMPDSPLMDETFHLDVSEIAEGLADVAKQLGRLATVAENVAENWEKFYQPGPYFKVGTRDTER